MRDDLNRDVSADFLAIDGDSIHPRRPVMPSMLTSNEEVIRQDCLCYLMERLPLPPA